MKQTCRFQSGRDIMQTVPGLEVKVSDSIDYHRIQDTSVPSMYNGQQTFEDVGSRIHEPFDVIEYDRAYTRVRHYHNSKKKDSDDSGKDK